MPRPLRRGGHAHHDPATTTPTRPRNTNAITAAIPPFMLETPPHAPFLTTPLPPSNNPGNSIVPAANNRRHPQAETQQTPIEHADIHDPDNSQTSTQPLGSAVSEAGNGEEQSYLESVHHDIEDAKQLRGLRDISSLATWTLSSAKPGCALAQLRNPSSAQFWQSDGPQPHTLTLHFFKLVAIVKMRIYLDFELDESYTPTKMKFFAGMSEGGLVEFGSWEVTETTDPETGETHSSIAGVRGWIDVPLKGVGGRETRYYDEDESADVEELEETSVRGIKSTRGKTKSRSRLEADGGDDLTPGDVLKAMVVQVRICENHQNGKDTHVRGFQVFARDQATTEPTMRAKKNTKSRPPVEDAGDESDTEEVIGLTPADWMGEPVIR